MSASHAPAPSASPASATAATLPEILLDHARFRPGEPAFTFLRDGEEADSALTWSALAQRAMGIAGALAARNLAGERVLLVLNPGLDFVCAFYGCLLAGAVAVPLAPPTTRRLLERTRGVIADCRARAVVATSASRAAVQELVEADRLEAVLIDQAEERAPVAPPGPRDAAFLQYTSGSTGAPRGVVVTHGNLVAGSLYIQGAFAMRQQDVVVNWLPVLHDMGLIGSVVQAAHIGQHSIHMSPQAMIRKPLRWLQAISRWRATVTGGPDFAWRLLADRLAPADLVGLDLSCLRVAYTGSEAVRASTLERTGALLATAGFDARAWLPCYGLAEATLLVTGGPAWSGARIAAIPGQAGGTTYVASGAPIPAGAVAVVDPADGTALPEGRVGEVWVAGDHVADGYWNRPEATAAAFGARLPGDPRAWLRTGDLAFLLQGQLHITGRIKDLLIVNGRKHHPEDVETTIQDMVPGCRSGACAVFQTEDGDGQRLVAAIEMAERPEGDQALAALLGAVASAVWMRHELTVHSVLPVRVGLLPRTTSGKVRRGETRALYLAGSLARPARDA